MARSSAVSRLTAEYPQDLASALATVIAPCVSKGNTVLPLDSWKTRLPSKLQWPTVQHRIEDGGGLPSTALHMSRPSSDPLVALRSRWFKRLSDTKQCLKIVAALLSGCKEPPLSPDELAPYIDDLIELLDSPPGDHLLHAPPGQPFKLHLWYQLASFLGDPDAPFLLDLVQGVPLAVNETLSPSPAWPTHTGTVANSEPLLRCSDSWKSAQDHPGIVDQLITEELQAGFIELVPGGLTELQEKYGRTAVGKLGVVLAEGRSPRLVVDSSISNVTVNTIIPNHMMLPRISDVLACAPMQMAQQQMAQLTLDVAKAHRRILIDPKDGGMLCFHANGKLYRCVTLNFGARASGWYWGRVAGLMVRTGHSLLGYVHVLWQYVDDLLAWLESVSAPLWASILVILFMILGIPLSWHKAALSMEVDWIGWRISLASWSILVPDTKIRKIMSQVHALMAHTKVPVKDLQSLVGRLLWLTSAWHYLRPLLIPLYKALSRLPVTMVGMDHVDVTLVRVANTHVKTVTEVQRLHLRRAHDEFGLVFLSQIPLIASLKRMHTLHWRSGSGC